MDFIQFVNVAEIKNKGVILFGRTEILSKM